MALINVCLLIILMPLVLTPWRFGVCLYLCGLRCLEIIGKATLRIDRKGCKVTLLGPPSFPSVCYFPMSDASLSTSCGLRLDFLPVSKFVILCFSELTLLHFIFCFHNALESFLSSISSLPWSNFETIPSLVWITKVASRVVHSVWSCINSPPFTLLLEDFFVFCHPPKAQVCLSLPFSKNFHTPPPSAIG